MNHPTVSGNKWWKLKYNLEEAKKQDHYQVMTFGGSFSNHIYATATAAKEERLQPIGIIRGERTLPLNPTLSFAESQGMELHFISREAYRKKTETHFLRELEDRFGKFYLIPEGGTNQLAVKGCVEFALQELPLVEFDHLFLPVGTGGTIAGIICGLKGEKNITGVTVLKQGEFLREEIERLCRDFSGNTYENWSLLTSYHHGGYAKVTKGLLAFIREMEAHHQLPLDHVYTGKVLWAVMKEIEQGAFKRGTTILVLHTGGLQGRNATASA